jgi:hypothetical protein
MILAVMSIGLLKALRSEDTTPRAESGPTERAEEPAADREREGEVTKSR